MWEKGFELILPPGYTIKENPDLLYLYYRGELVAIFSAIGVKVEKIREKIERHQRSLKS